MVKKIITLAAVALAIACAIPSTRARIVDQLRPIKDKVASSLVPRRVDAMADQLDVRLGRGEGLPEGFEGWLRRDYTGSELDPWDRLYYLTSNRRSYRVGSMGPDGVQGSEDDIYEERMLPGSGR
jgi:hypothetical protein